MPFASKAQQRFAYATGQPWRHEWAEATKKKKGGFAKLPQHVAKASIGMFSPAEVEHHAGLHDQHLRDAKRYGMMEHPNPLQASQSRHTRTSPGPAGRGTVTEVSSNYWSAKGGRRRPKLRLITRGIAKAERTFSDERREKLAAKGKTAYGTSFPMPDKDAVRRARMSLGRAKHPERARRKIAERMRQLHMSTEGTAFTGVGKSWEAPMSVSAFGVLHAAEPEELAKLDPAALVGGAKQFGRGVKSGVGGWSESGVGKLGQAGKTVGQALTNAPEHLQNAAAALTSPKTLATAAGVGAVAAGARKTFQAARAGKKTGAAAGEAAGSLRRVGNWAAANPGKAAVAGGGVAGGAYLAGRKNNSD